MLHALGQGAANLGNIHVLLLILLGTVAGLFTGLLPGLGVIVILTVLLPFTYHMTPFEAFGLLLAVYSVFTITGDITSILIGIPSHPECAAMVLDGYPMTKRGEAARALGASISSAALGAIVGAIVLFVSIPVLRQLVLRVGSPQLFALILLGLTMVGSLSGSSVLKGVMSASLGLLLATVGTSAETGIIRFGFGSVYLVQGLPLVALALALFAVPEMMGLYARGSRSLADGVPKVGGGAMRGFLDTVTRPGLVLRGSLIGAFTAMLPGLGSAVGQWAAYGQAAQISRTPELFGSGCIEGVIAPGAANNSKEGGALVPTLAFGVPGSAAMAVLLASFEILGIQPGPAMLSQNLDITYFMILVMVITNVFGAGLSFLLLRPLARMTLVSGSGLMPFVACLIIVGSCSGNSEWGDLVVLLGGGLIAWVLRECGWPVAPIILGFVLGKSAENFFWTSTGAYGINWLFYPSVDVIFAITVAVVVLTIIRRTRSTESSLKATAPMPDLGHMSIVAVAGALTLLGVLAVVLALPWPPTASGFPIAIASVLSLLGLLVIVQEVRILRKMPVRRPIRALVPSWSSIPAPLAEASIDSEFIHQIAGTDSAEDDAPFGSPDEGGNRALEEQQMHGAQSPRIRPGPSMVSEPRLSIRRSLIGLAWMIGVGVTAYVAGFLVSFGAFVVIYMLVLRRRWWVALVTGGVVSAIFYGTFVRLLSVQLPFPLLGPRWV